MKRTYTHTWHPGGTVGIHRSFDMQKFEKIKTGRHGKTKNLKANQSLHFTGREQLAASKPVLLGGS